MDRYWNSQEEYERHAYLKDLEDTHFFDAGSGIYKPKSCKPFDQTQNCPNAGHSRSPVVIKCGSDSVWSVSLGAFNAIVTFVTLLVVAAYTLASYGQWQEMHDATVATGKAAQAARDGVIQSTVATRLDQRAWVTVTAVNGAKPEVGHRLNFTVHFVDTGRTPAINVVVHPGDEILDTGKSPNLSLEHSAIRLGILSPGSEREYDNEPRKNGTETFELGEPDLAVLKTKTLSVHGKLTYDDIFGCHHWVTYSTYLKPDWSGYAFYPEGNDTDPVSDKPCHGK
jgi:hypothetical protein